MGKKLTEITIDNLKPRAYDHDVREGEGFALRVYRSGSKAWCFLYTIDGVPRRMNLGKYPAVGVAEARKRYRAAKDLFDQGLDPQEVARQKEREHVLAPTVSALIEEYIRDYAKPKKRTWKADEQMLQKNIKPDLGGLKVKEVTRREINLLLKKVVNRGAPRQANKVLAVARKMFNYAVKQGIIDQSPCHMIDPPSPEVAKDRILTTDEIRAVWNGFSKTRMADSFQRVLKLVLVTGLRPGEAGGICGEEIDGRWLTIPAARMKNKQPHRVYLADLALEVIGEIHNGPLFVAPESGKPVGSDALARTVKHYREKLGMAAWTPHDLRRTASTGFSQIGVVPFVAERVLSHKDYSVRGKHYDLYAYDKEKKAALEKWADHLAKILRREAPKGKVIRLF